ncbi:MAG TPA: BREX system Lon protease-like protein BrxL, partial [Clostridia bacterium]|nr:BREX system Lon protease-like protein BrxL [Clostridia bacterium]
MIEKLRNCFDEMVVYKDLAKFGNVFSALSLPSFMRDWLLKKFQDERGEFDADELTRFVKAYLPRKDDWNSIKNRVIKENERVRFLAKISVDIDIKTSNVSFMLPDYKLTNKETIIEDAVWQTCKEDLVRGKEIWGMVGLGYRPSD